LVSVPIAGEHVAILLTGDISSDVEHRLLGDLGDLNVLVAPHHGSRTSSGWPLLRRTTPDLAIFSAGYKNRYGHPPIDIIERYKAVGSTMLNTAESGAITLSWYGDGTLDVRTHRQHAHRFWH